MKFFHKKVKELSETAGEGFVKKAAETLDKELDKDSTKQWLVAGSIVVGAGIFAAVVGRRVPKSVIIINIYGK